MSLTFFIITLMLGAALYLFAAPSPTVRQSPGGRKLKDGYSAKITLSRDPDISFWEKTVKPPGVDGGDSIDETTMHNEDWRTAAPRALKTLTEMTTSAAYDPNIYSQIVEQINIEQTITVRFADGSTLAFYGFVRTFEPDDLEEGTQPTATITITPTNSDASNSDVEAGPALASVSGT
jgi:hypothetical protein